MSKAQPASPSPKVIATSSADQSSSRRPAERFVDRESKELVIAFSGPVGSGVNTVCATTERILREHGYDVVRVKISELIVRLSKTGFGKLGDLSNLRSASRITTLQDAGNTLRKNYGNDFLAELAITYIARNRISKLPSDADYDAHIPERRAYLIDQLKHQDEVHLLRTVYGDLFYLVGVFSCADKIKQNLKEYLSETEAVDVMERDRDENFNHGQKLEKTLKLSDIFLRNTDSNASRIENQLRRFISLLHGKNGITPTIHEHGMYAAHSAGLRSACLSRQVGASIADKAGNLLAVGCNDVPEPNGGLYTNQSRIDDRCVNREGGKCYNDAHKAKRIEKISNLLVDKYAFSSENAKAAAAEIGKAAGIKDLLEFSRSVHAEMDALVSVARVGGVSTKGAYLYTTTYPCHHCARHIIAAGISKVFYVEPYEKSLVKELHDMAIDSSSEEDVEGESSPKVKFLHFEGVSPRRYQSFFTPRFERKENGIATNIDIIESSKVIPKILDGYRDLESKVSNFLAKEDQVPDEIFSE